MKEYKEESITDWFYLEDLSSYCMSEDLLPTKLPDSSFSQPDIALCNSNFHNAFHSSFASQELTPHNALEIKTNFQLLSENRILRQEIEEAHTQLDAIAQSIAAYTTATEEEEQLASIARALRVLDNCPVQTTIIKNAKEQLKGCLIEPRDYEAAKSTFVKLWKSSLSDLYNQTIGKMTRKVPFLKPIISPISYLMNRFSPKATFGEMTIVGIGGTIGGTLGWALGETLNSIDLFNFSKQFSIIGGALIFGPIMAKLTKVSITASVRSLGMVVAKNFASMSYDNPTHLTTDISQIIERRCPIERGKKVKDTHFLVYVPTVVSEKKSYKLEEVFWNQINKRIPAKQRTDLYESLNIEKKGKRDNIEPKEHWFLIYHKTIDEASISNYENTHRVATDQEVVFSSIMFAIKSEQIKKEADSNSEAADSSQRMQEFPRKVGSAYTMESLSVQSHSAKQSHLKEVALCYMIE